MSYSWGASARFVRAADEGPATVERVSQNQSAAENPRPDEHGADHGTQVASPHLDYDELAAFGVPTEVRS